MDVKDIRSVILNSFSSARETPGEEYDAEDFLNDLTADGEALDDPESVSVTLNRMRKFYRGMQLACGVCLPFEDMQRRWSVDALAEHVAKLKADPAAQKQLAAERVATAEKMKKSTTIKLGLCLVLPALLVLWSFIGDWSTGLVLVPLALAAVYLIFHLQQKDVAFAKELRAAVLKASKVS